MTTLSIPNLTTAVIIAHQIEPIAAGHGLHIALTGGCLYKLGPRKDIDFVLYKHDHNTYTTKRWWKRTRTAFEADLVRIHFVLEGYYSRVTKGTFHNYAIDLIYPAFEGTYPEEDA